MTEKHCHDERYQRRHEEAHETSKILSSSRMTNTNY